MKHLLWLFATISLVVPAAGQSIAPVRLAIIAETSDASPISDLLTTELSKNPQVTLQERNEISRAYREQGLSAANRDFLKLGQVLGADGVLLVGAKTASNLPGFAPTVGGKPKLAVSAQLIAVKPGVLLASEQFPAIDNLPQWASGYAAHLNPNLPKLSVLEKDAVPVSIVNLRAAMKSSETEELERQLTALAIQRLSHERQLFVLERRKMELLASETELKGLNNSAFWNGSYLLDGTIDRDGYSKDTLTLSARLVPPNGGTPLAIEVRGSRTNLNEVINRLAEKVRGGLKLASSAAPWNTADEAQKYFEEAKWALKWNLIEAAETASDSAWVLGKQDLDCALVRVRAYLAELAGSVVKYQSTESSLSPGYNAAGEPNGPAPSQQEINDMIRDELTQHHYGAAYRQKPTISRNSIAYEFAFAESPPDPANIGRAQHLLELYYNFSRTHPDGLPQPGTEATNWKNSLWTDLGIGVLTNASKVLRDFNFAAGSQQSRAAGLGELRALTRTLAEFMAQPQSVQNTYFVGTRPATHDELCYTLQEDPNIFACEVNWTAFWQEKPEETLAVYRKLMSSATFCYLHNGFFNRELSQPRLVGWNDEDKKRIPLLWKNFTAELQNSTNVLWQMEAAALAKSDAPTRQLADAAETNWWKIVRTHHQELVANNVELFYLGWGFTGYNQETEAMDSEYWAKTLPIVKTSDSFQRQKKYLTEFTPYDFFEFNKVFNNDQYSKSQAAELKPLVEAYQSNLLAQANATTTNRLQKLKIQGGARWVAFTVGKRVDEILNPAPKTNRVNIATAPPTPPIASSAPTTPLPPLSNILTVTKYLAITKEMLHTEGLQESTVIEHRMENGRLMLHLIYHDDARPSYMADAGVYRQAAGFWSPERGWDFIPLPQQEDMSAFIQAGYSRISAPFCIETLGDTLYASGENTIRSYNLVRKQWRELPFPGQDHTQLFGANNHLYAANSEAIWEILNGGQSSRILASTRRRPIVTSLDSRDTLASPALFSGKDNALCVALNGEVFSWDGNDWKSLLNIPKSHPAELFENEVLFRTGNYAARAECWRLFRNQNQAELCLRERQSQASGIFPPRGAAATNSGPEPTWKLPPGLSLDRALAAVDGPNLYFFIDRTAKTTGPTGAVAFKESRGRHAELVCLVSNFRSPLIVPIKFDVQRGPAPFPAGWAIDMTTWVDCSTDFLFIGEKSIPGVWALPKVELQAELERQLQHYRAEESERKNALLAKYDLNHNGTFDPEDRESAINDPSFLTFELDAIDANSDDLLDANELSYFDANKNGILEPAEEEGIRIAQGLLAEKLFKGFDWDENGILEMREMQSLVGNNSAMSFRNGRADIDEIKRFVEITTDDSLRDRAKPARGNPFRAMPPPYQTTPRQPSLKQRVEADWAMEKSGQTAQKPSAQ
jgi:hypothetical protein